MESTRDRLHLRFDQRDEIRRRESCRTYKLYNFQDFQRFVIFKNRNLGILLRNKLSLISISEKINVSKGLKKNFPENLKAISTY